MSYFLLKYERISHKIDFKAVWPHCDHADSMGVKWGNSCRENFHPAENFIYTLKNDEKSETRAG